VVTVPGPKSAEHDRAGPDRPRDRSREKDPADKQRPASVRTDHSVMSQRDVRLDHPKDGSGDRSRDTRALPDRQPVKTTAAAVSESRAKSTSSSSAGGQLTTSSQPRSSCGSIPARSDTAPDKSFTKVSDYLFHALTVCTGQYWNLIVYEQMCHKHFKSSFPMSYKLPHSLSLLDALTQSRINQCIRTV